MPRVAPARLRGRRRGGGGAPNRSGEVTCDGDGTCDGAEAGRTAVTAAAAVQVRLSSVVAARVAAVQAGPYAVAARVAAVALPARPAALAARPAAFPAARAFSRWVHRSADQNLASACSGFVCFADCAERSRICCPASGDGPQPPPCRVMEPRSKPMWTVRGFNEVATRLLGL
jgi:hypothetical protein